MVNEDSLNNLEQMIKEMEDRTGDLPEWMEQVNTWHGYIDAIGAQLMLERNIKPQPGKAGTNRPLVRGSVEEKLEAILGSGWRFNHQGIAFDNDGWLIDGQHRLEAIVRADKVSPGIQVPLMVTWGLPPNSNEKIDLVRRRSTGTFLAMMGDVNTSRLNTTLKMLYFYDTTDFDKAIDPNLWKRPVDLEIIKQMREEHPLAVPAMNIGGQLQGIFTASAAATGWTLCRERYPDEMNIEFVAGIKDGASLEKGDPRLAVRNWSINRRERGMKLVPYVHLAVYLKAFRAYRLGESMDTIGFRPTYERMPRP